MRSFPSSPLVLAVVLSVASMARAEEVKVQVVKYAGLGETINQLKGKVAVVDFWADT